MCGIFGVVTKNDCLSTESFRKHTNALAHRGPDFQDVWISESQTVGLGHTRLSILDVSDDANQPFHSRDRRYVMVYNGEVYNFREIAKDLKIETRTTGDTEVIIEAFAKGGVEVVNRFNGMFAIAIWDRTEEVMFLFRDRMGIKPLYYYQDGEMLVFASELKAITRYLVGKVKLTVSQRAFQYFLHLGYIPQPYSVYEQVRKFPQGSFGILNDTELEQHSYWDIDNQVNESLLSNESEARDQLSALLTDSIQMRLISDVPIGTFLSGGIDSSLVTAVASGLTTEKLRTFSIGFEESAFNESHFARQIASHLNTDHTEFILSEREAIPLFDQLLGTFDEPFADTSAIPTMLISRLAASQVKVILTGDGGDEQFLGYGAYDWANRLASPLVGNPLVKRVTKKGLSLGNNRLKRVSYLFNSNNSIRSHIFSQEQYLFDSTEIAQLLNHYRSEHDFIYTDRHHRSPAELQSIFDLKYYLPDDLLVKVDRSSMRYGLECRVPLLDYRLVEFSMNLSSDLKKKDKTSKYLLKQILYQYLPKAYFDRPKWGFSIPLASWLKSDLSYLISYYLNDEVVKELGFFDPNSVRSYIERFDGGESYLYNRIWLMIVWHRWILEHE